MDFKKTTESESQYQNLDKMSVSDLLKSINEEDKKVPDVIERIIPDIEIVVKVIVEKMKSGGRLYYMGAGTSGRLGVVDASECPPTFGIDHGVVIALIAGGDTAIRKAVEFAEDSHMQGWLDLESHKVSTNDVVIGIAASGTTPYVIGALLKCNEKGITTACITCNAGSPLTQVAQYKIAAVVGPEFVTGSTRMKAGTAQKLILNMISTAVMIQLGKVKGNKMVDMKLANVKLIDRGVKMVMNELQLEDYNLAKELLTKYGSVRAAIENYKK